MTDETHLQKYGVMDFYPDAIRSKPSPPLLTSAELAEIDARKADAVYLGWPIKPQVLNMPINMLFANAYRRKADAKRKQVADGTSHPENFPNVIIRSPEAAIAARIADTLDALADDLEKMA